MKMMERKAYTPYGENRIWQNGIRRNGKTPSMHILVISTNTDMLSTDTIS